MDLAEASIGFRVERNSGTQIETNRGTINNHVYVHSGRSPIRRDQGVQEQAWLTFNAREEQQHERSVVIEGSTSEQRQFTPSNTIPYRRDPDYVERMVLSDIFRRSSAPASRVALVGLGGVGKSQLAIEYVHRIHDSDPQTWAFWIHAASKERFRDSFSTIAKYLNLPGCHDPPSDVLGQVHLWLLDRRNGRWVLIVDSADDDRVLFERDDENSGVAQPHMRLLADYLPQSPHGSILVTSRSRDVAYRLVGRDQDIIPIGPMEANDALALLQKKLRHVNDTGIVLELAKQLDYIPLALTQAAAYINRRPSRTGVRKFIQRLRQSSPEQIRLLEEDLGDTRRDIQSSNSIVLTLQISFAYLGHTAPSAARLLAWMSLFDREAIPEFLLTQAYWEDGSRPILSDVLEDDIAALMALDLIRPNLSQDSFSMHRVVQLSTWRWLETRKQLFRYWEHYVEVLIDEFPLVEAKSRQQCQKIIPHVLMAAAYHVEGHKHSRLRGRLLFRATRYLIDLDQGQVARSLMDECVRSLRKVFGEDDIFFLEAYEYLLQAFHLPEKQHEIENVQQKLLTHALARHGWNHSYTLQILTRRGSAMLACGQTEHIQLLTEKSVEIYESIQQVEEKGDESGSDYTWSLVDLLLNQNKHDDVEKILKRQIAVKQGRGDSNIYEEQFGIVLCLQAQEKYQEAQASAEELLPVFRTYFGFYHRLTLHCMGCLAQLLQRQNKFEAAESLLRESPTIPFNDLPNTKSTYVQQVLLSECLAGQSKYAEAIAVCEEAIRISTRMTDFEQYRIQGQSLLRHLLPKVPKENQSIPASMQQYMDSDISSMLVEP